MRRFTPHTKRSFFISLFSLISLLSPPLITQPTKADLELLHAASTGDSERASTALEAGAHMNIRDEFNQNALEKAEEASHLEVALLLIHASPSLSPIPWVNWWNNSEYTHAQAIIKLAHLLCAQAPEKIILGVGRETCSKEYIDADCLNILTILKTLSDEDLKELLTSSEARLLAAICTQAQSKNKWDAALVQAINDLINRTNRLCRLSPSTLRDLCLEYARLQIDE